MPENIHLIGKGHCLVGLQLNWIGFDQTRKMLLIDYSDTAESKQVKLETFWKVILTPTVSVLCSNFQDDIIHLYLMKSNYMNWISNWISLTNFSL